MAVKKLIGWGKCSVKDGTKTYDDIKEGTASLSVEEGSIEEALIEGGEAEATRSMPDKYILEFDRRIGAEAEVTPGYTEDAGDVIITPPTVGAIGVKLMNVCRKITLKGDSTDGLMAHYWYKTKGAHDDNGNITDVVAVKKTATQSGSGTGN